MEFIVHFLTQYGYWGMLLAAFLAGSFFPFSSEAVMIGLMATGLDPWLLMIAILPCGNIPVKDVFKVSTAMWIRAVSWVIII